MKRHWSGWCGAMALVLLTACSKDPTAPTPHTITGHVRLTAFTVDTAGVFIGQRQVDDADGVPVELLHGSRVVGRTTTTDGNYRFSGLAAGDYVARSFVVGKIGDQTRTMVVAVDDVVSRDTLRLISSGELYPVPNPFAQDTRVYFHLEDSVFVNLDVRGVGGQMIRTLRSKGLAAGGYIVFWDGLDEGGQAASSPYFWITLVADTSTRAHLIIRGTPIP